MNRWRDVIPQMHLSTAIWLMVASGFLLWINAKPTDNGGIGFPLHVTSVESTRTWIFSLCIDALLAIAILCFIAALLEEWIPREPK